MCELKCKIGGTDPGLRGGCSFELRLGRQQSTDDPKVPEMNAIVSLKRTTYKLSEAKGQFYSAGLVRTGIVVYRKHRYCYMTVSVAKNI